MQRYLKTESADGASFPCVVRLDYVRTAKGGDTVTCINGTEWIQIPFEEFCSILESDDSRQVIDWKNWPPVLTWLARNRICDYVKEMGVENTLRFLRDIITDGDTWETCQRLYLDYLKDAEIKGKK